MRRLWTLDGHCLLAPLFPPKNRISEDGHAYLRLRSLASSPKHFAFCIFDNNENNAFKKYGVFMKFRKRRTVEKFREMRFIFLNQKSKESFSSDKFFAKNYGKTSTFSKLGTNLHCLLSGESTILRRFFFRTVTMSH